MRYDGQLFSTSTLYMENVKHTEKMKELYIKHPCIYLLDSTINILQYMLSHISIYLSNPLSI